MKKQKLKTVTKIIFAITNRGSGINSNAYYSRLKVKELTDRIFYPFKKKKNNNSARNPYSKIYALIARK